MLTDFEVRHLHATYGCSEQRDVPIESRDSQVTAAERGWVVVSDASGARQLCEPKRCAMRIAHSEAAEAQKDQIVRNGMRTSGGNAAVQIAIHLDSSGL